MSTDRVTEVAPEQLAFDANLFQCAFWARFKQMRRTPTQAFHIHHNGRRYPLVVVHRRITADASLGYAPLGPDVILPAEDQGPFLERVAEELRDQVPTTCRFLRFDLPWRNPYTDSGDWDEPPEARVREMRMNYGCRHWNLHKAPSDLHAPDTVILDLERSPDELLRAMHKKHRYCIRAASRRGVEVTIAAREQLPAWHRLYLDTAERRGIVAETLDYFLELFATARQHDPELRLYLAHRNGKLLAGSVVGFVGSSAYYLFSASSPSGRSLFASFAVVWRAICDAGAAGCRRFDLMGIPPDPRPGHPMHGLYRFKTRFGGTLRHRRGCWDYPLDERSYAALALAGDLQNAFHRR